MIVEEATDAKLWQFMEDWLGLHRDIDFSYVVDGYEASLTDDDGTKVIATAKGTTLREAVYNLWRMNNGTEGSDEDVGRSPTRELSERLCEKHPSISTPDTAPLPIVRSAWWGYTTSEGSWYWRCDYVFLEGIKRKLGWTRRHRNKHTITMSKVI